MHRGAYCVPVGSEWRGRRAGSTLTQQTIRRQRAVQAPTSMIAADKPRIQLIARLLQCLVAWRGQTVQCWRSLESRSAEALQDAQCVRTLLSSPRPSTARARMSSLTQSLMVCIAFIGVLSGYRGGRQALARRRRPGPPTRRRRTKQRSPHERPQRTTASPNAHTTRTCTCYSRKPTCTAGTARSRAPRRRLTPSCRGARRPSGGPFQSLSRRKFRLRRPFLGHIRRTTS